MKEKSRSILWGIKTLVGRRGVLALHYEINKSSSMVKVVNMESKGRDGVGERQGQMSAMRKGGERIPSIVEVLRNAEVLRGVSEPQMSAYQQGNINRIGTAKMALNRQIEVP